MPSKVYAFRFTENMRLVLDHLISREQEGLKEGYRVSQTAIIERLLLEEGKRLGMSFAASMVKGPPKIPVRFPSGKLVYFVQSNGHGRPIKIGLTTNLTQRLAVLRTSHADGLEVVGMAPGGAALERELHKKFSDACITGEWFRPVPELLAYIEEQKASAPPMMAPVPEPVDLAAVREQKALNEAGKSELPRPEVIEETVQMLKDQSEKPPLRLATAPVSAPVDDHGPPALPPWVGAARGENESGDEPAEADPDLSDKDLDELLNGMGDD